jgi:hypothetical protein
MTTDDIYYAYYDIREAPSAIQWTTSATTGLRRAAGRVPVGMALRTTAPAECLVQADGDILRITGPAIRAGAITADHISVTSLSAISADIGTITAGVLQSSDYDAGAGTGIQFDLTNSMIRVGGGNISFSESGITVDLVDTEPLPDEFFVLKRNGTQGASIEMFNFAIGANYYERLILTGKGQVQLFADSGGSYDAYITVSRGVGGGFPVPSLITLDSKIVKLTMTTETLEFMDAGSTGATEQDWIEVEVGGNQGYIRVYATK